MPSYKETKPTGRIPIIITYHPSVVRDNETIIKELKSNSKLTSSKPESQIYNVITTDSEINIPGTSHIYHPGNYDCDSTNIVYLLMRNKCNYGNDVGETSKKLRLGMNNHNKSIRDNHKGLPVVYITIRRTIPSMTFRVLY